MTTAWTTDISTQDAARAVQQTLLWGLDGIALRSIGDARVPNVTEGPLYRRLEDAELPIVALDPGLFEGDASPAIWLNDIAVLDDLAPFARRAKCDLVRIGAFASGDLEDRVRALSSAGDQARRLGLRLAVRNESGTSVGTGAELAMLLGRVAEPNVGADWRPADALDGGELPADGLQALVEGGFVPWVVGVRDPIGGREAEIGQGHLGWADHLVALRRAGFDGPLVIDALPDPARTAGLASSTALIQMSRAAARANPSF